MVLPRGEEQLGRATGRPGEAEAHIEEMSGTLGTRAGPESCACSWGQRLTVAPSPPALFQSLSLEGLGWEG